MKNVIKIITNSDSTMLIKFIKQKRATNSHALVLFVGEQRSGKTWLAMKTAEDIIPDWDIEKYMFNDIESLLQAYLKYNNQIFILDEVGISLDSSDFLSYKQRIHDHIIQTQAYKNNIIFYVLPFALGIGKKHRYYVNALVKVLRRGTYRLDAVNYDHASLSFKTPFRMHIETITNVPKPSKRLQEIYINHFQKKYKEKILASEIEFYERKSGLLKKEKPIINLV